MQGVGSKDFFVVLLFLKQGCFLLFSFLFLLWLHGFPFLSFPFCFFVGLEVELIYGASSVSFSRSGSLVFFFLSFTVKGSGWINLITVTCL